MRGIARQVRCSRTGLAPLSIPSRHLPSYSRDVLAFPRMAPAKAGARAPPAAFEALHKVVNPAWPLGTSHPAPCFSGLPTCCIWGIVCPPFFLVPLLHFRL